MLSFEEVRKLVPQKYPFLFIDKVIELQKESRIVCLKNISGNEPFFAGHFPDFAIMPGVLIIEALAQALEVKDSYTKGHSKRVTGIALIIGKEMGIDNKELDKLKLSGILHDIGKIGVKEAILNKPTRLTKEEYQSVMIHPETGARILDFLIKDKEIINTIKHHHEFYNGKGFPDGLKGDEIPFFARILAVADAFDAMTSTRPYRDAISFGYAYDELEKYKDKELVVVCRTQNRSSRAAEFLRGKGYNAKYVNGGMQEYYKK